MPMMLAFMVLAFITDPIVRATESGEAIKRTHAAAKSGDWPLACAWWREAIRLQPSQATTQPFAARCSAAPSSARVLSAAPAEQTGSERTYDRESPLAKASRLKGAKGGGGFGIVGVPYTGPVRPFPQAVAPPQAPRSIK